MRLHDFELSSDCYMARLLLGFLGIDYETVPVDVFPGRENLTDAFREISPFGDLPVLEDGEDIVRGSQAVLVHLATRYDASGTWFPLADPQSLARQFEWLDVARRLARSIGAARMALSFSLTLDIPQARANGHEILRHVDEYLWFAEKRGEDWMCPGDAPTLADLACFAHIVLSEECGVSRQDYPAIRRWIDRFRRVPGFTVMSGVFPASRAK